MGGARLKTTPFGWGAGPPATVVPYRKLWGPVVRPPWDASPFWPVKTSSTVSRQRSPPPEGGFNRNTLPEPPASFGPVTPYSAPWEPVTTPEAAYPSPSAALKLCRTTYVHSSPGWAGGTST